MPENLNGQPNQGAEEQKRITFKSKKCNGTFIAIDEGVIINALKKPVTIEISTTAGSDGKRIVKCPLLIGEFCKATDDNENYQKSRQYCFNI